MTEPELTSDQSDRLAEALIDEAITEVLLEQRTAVDQCTEDLKAAAFALKGAQRKLKELRRSRADWDLHREVDYTFGQRVLMHAQFADFTPSTAPPGTHVRAVKSYFERHPPRVVLDRLTQPSHRLRRVLRRR